MIYVFVYALLICAYLLTPQRAAQKLVVVFAFTALFLFSAFRWEVGCDWVSYESIFVRTLHGFLGADFWGLEQGWYWTNVVIARAGLSYPWVNVITSVIFFTGIFALARRSANPLFYITVLFPFLIIGMSMSGIRQAAAIGFICLAFVAFIDRRPLRFALMVLLGVSFHSSALLFMLLLPFSQGEFTFKKLLLGVLITLPGIYFLAQTDAADRAIVRYVETGLEAAGAQFRVGLVGMVGLYFWLVLRQPWLRSGTSDLPLVSIGSLMMIAALPLLAVSSVIADRIAYFAMPLAALILARAPSLVSGNRRFLHTLIPLALLSAAFLTWVAFSIQFRRCYTPYDTWIFGFPVGPIF